MFVLDIPDGLRVLAISPHSDDVELGAGATLLWLKTKRYADLFYRVLSTDHVTTEDGKLFSRADESRAAAAALGVDVADADRYAAANFVDTEFPEQRKQIHRYLERAKEEIDPHLVISPSACDMHQDHITIAETVMRVFREGQTLWHYEICQFNRSERFVPSLFVDVTERIWWDDVGQTMSFAERKNAILQASFVSQRDTIYLDQDVIMGNMRMRGQQCARAAVKYAEAFQSRVSLFDYQGYRQGAVHRHPAPPRLFDPANAPARRAASEAA